MRGLTARLTVLVIMLGAIAFPAAAQYEGCRACQTYCVESEDGCVMYCGSPDNNSWGWENCEFRSFSNGRVVTCRGVGVSCYYFDVEG